jgi:cytochrome c2
VRIPSDPDFLRLVRRSAAAFVVALAVGAAFIPAPLREAADLGNPPNPAKSAWFLLWSQELVSHGTGWIYVAFAAALLLVALPWLPGKGRTADPGDGTPPAERAPRYGGAIAFALFLAFLVLTIVAAFFRGPNWGWTGFSAVVRATGATAAFRPAMPEGRLRLERSGCRRCHVTGGEGNRLATDLDGMFGAPPGRLIDAIRSPAVHMPDFRFDEDSIRELADAIHANGAAHGKGGASGPGHPLKVHFDRGASDSNAPPFESRCGGCHRAIGSGGRGMGQGNIGPNLSGLFTPFHPGRVGPGVRWSPEALARWADNPRTIRPVAKMPPVPVSAAEFRAIVDSLR